jgi:hypothetical protein
VQLRVGVDAGRVANDGRPHVPPENVLQLNNANPLAVFLQSLLPWMSLPPDEQARQRRDYDEDDFEDEL